MVGNRSSFAQPDVRNNGARPVNLSDSAALAPAFAGLAMGPLRDAPVRCLDGSFDHDAGPPEAERVSMRGDSFRPNAPIT